MWIWLAAVALAGTPEARFAEGVAAIQGGDAAAAAVAFEASCTAGYALACSNLASQLALGHGLPRDAVRAASLHRTACEAGLALSCDALGTLTTNGVGVPPDDAVAVGLYRKACDLELASGCAHLAVMVDGGFGVDRSWEDAKAAYGKACDLGDAGSCWSLGKKLLGLRRADLAVEGMERTQRACELGVAEACAVAAASVTDPKLSRTLAERACALGHAESCR